jgi:hypothetical protein
VRVIDDPHIINAIIALMLAVIWLVLVACLTMQTPPDDDSFSY